VSSVTIQNTHIVISNIEMTRTYLLMVSLLFACSFLFSFAVVDGLLKSENDVGAGTSCFTFPVGLDPGLVVGVALGLAVALN